MIWQRVKHQETESLVLEKNSKLTFGFPDEYNIDKNPKQKKTQGKYWGKTVYLKPRDYQEMIVDMIFSSDDHYGRIVSLETGLGKTFISLMILCKRLSIDYTRLNDKRELNLHKRSSNLRSKIVFLVPTKNLLEQQYCYFRKHLPSYFEVLEAKNSSEFSESKKLFVKEERPTMAVMIHKVFLSLLRSGNVKISEVDVLVFDECHHAQKDHPYNLIMREFYFYGIDFEEKDESVRYMNRPYILGLTASPIKNKIKQPDRLQFRFEMMDQMKDLCSNLHSKIVSIDMNRIDETLVRKLKTKFVDYRMDDYWKKLSFANDPSKVIPSIREVFESKEHLYTSEKREQVLRGIETFEREIMQAMKGRRKSMGFSNIVPEKATQIIGNTYKETLECIRFEDFPDEIRVALIMTIAFYVYMDNILANVGIQGLKIFIEDFCSRFKYNCSQDKTGVMHEYLSEWKEGMEELQLEYNESSLCPKLQQLINHFFKPKFDTEDQMIIFVDQRLIADLLYKTIVDIYDDKDKHRIDVVYSHANSNLFKKIFKRTKIDSDKIMELFENVLNFENSYGRSLSAQKKTIQKFKDGQVKVLIATAVIEEGLDIPSCNKIIAYDKIHTPKSFIQMAGRARQIDSSISFMCLNTELEETKENIMAMENYKELLQANESLSRIIPDIRQRSCTYKPDEIFIIEDTGARVSIDGSMDLLNMVLQKLARKYKISKLTEHFEVDAGMRQKIITPDERARVSLQELPIIPQESSSLISSNFKCLLSITIKSEKVEVNDAKPHSTKSKAKSQAALQLIIKLYEMGYIDDYLNTAYSVNTRDKKVVQMKKLQERQEEMKKQKKFKQEKKAKQNREEIEGIQFTYQLTHDELSKLEVGDEGGQMIQVMIMAPLGLTYPFMNTSKNRCVGFLTDSQMVSRNEELSIYPRSEQFDRIHHFFSNISEKSLKRTKIKYRDYIFEMPMEEKVSFRVNTKKFELNKMQLHKLKFFHAFIFTVIYSAESSFYESLLKAEWNFGYLFSDVLELVKQDVKNEHIFANTNAYKRGNFDDSLYMYTIPIVDREIDWEIIDSCVNHAKLRLMTFGNLSQVLRLRAQETPLRFRDLPAFCEEESKYSYGYDDDKRSQAKQEINSKLKFEIFDTVTNGGKYFYHSERPSCDLQSGFNRANEKKAISLLNQASKIPSMKVKKEFMSFVDFYRHQYAFSPAANESLYCLNKLTTPKETVQRKKNQKKEREELSKFDFPISLLSLNPVGMHYFELFGLSIGMYIKLKEEFRTIEFIKRYFSQVILDKNDEPESNNYLFSYNQNFKPMVEKWPKYRPEAEIDIKRMKLSTIFLEEDNYKVILKSLTCSSANRGYDYELYEFMGDAVIALLLRFETVLLNRDGDENLLDLERIKNESNKRFYEINKRLKFYDYMIGSSDISAKTFIPPMFDKLEFEKICLLKRNEMSNKLLYYKCIKESYRKELEKIKDLLPEDDFCEEAKLDQDLLDTRMFKLKKIKRSNSQDNFHKHISILEGEGKKEKNHETLEEKVYRMTTFCDYNIKSLEKSLEEIAPEKLEEEFKKEFSVKQFADVIESLTAAVYDKAGLHGSQIFLKSLGLIDSKRDFKENFLLFLKEMQSLDTTDYKHPMKEVEKIIGYKFKYKRFLIIALTHSSMKKDIKIRDNFFNCYENLEYLGDVVHKFFVVKRIKEMSEKDLQNFENEGWNSDCEDDQEDAFGSLNLKKAAAESNNFLGFICVHKEIYKAILHTTPLNNEFKSYSKRVKEEERKARLNSSASSKEMVKLNLNFDQFSVKMLADVMEAIIGAIFLDCLAQSFEKEMDEPEEEEEKEVEKRLYLSEDDAVTKAENVWKGFICPYLELYADNPVTSDKSKYYNALNRVKYFDHFKKNSDIVMTHYTLEDIRNINSGYKDCDRITREQKQMRTKGEDTIQGRAILRYSYSLRLTIRRKKKTVFRIIYDQNFKKKDLSFYKVLYPHIEKIMKEYEEEYDEDDRDSNGKEFYAMVKDYFNDIDQLEVPSLD